MKNTIQNIIKGILFWGACIGVVLLIWAIEGPIEDTGSFILAIVATLLCVVSVMGFFSEEDIKKYSGYNLMIKWLEKE